MPELILLELLLQLTNEGLLSLQRLAVLRGKLFLFS
jgi:hypothetical protein